MTPLHIEHAIVDLGLWNSAFDRFAEFRVNAGLAGTPQTKILEAVDRT